MALAHKIEVYAKKRSEPLWKLLASDNAPVILSVLQIHLFDHERLLPSSVFHERVTRELLELRNRGWHLPQTAQLYIAEWLVSGYLERTFPKNATEEVYELSAPAVQAIQFIDGLEKKHRTATESRLSLVIQQLVQLAEQTDKNPQARIAQLEKERARIDAEIRSIHEGKIKVLSNDRALERLSEIVMLAQELTHDFRYVRDNFQQLNRNFREKIVESDGSRGEILKQLFSGVDIIAESESGRSFTAFWRLLIDPEQSLLLEEATEQILSRPFAKHIQRQDRQFLSKLTKILLDQGGIVHDVLQFFARSLRNFVQSRAYQEQRRLIQLLRDAQRQAISLKDHIHPTDIIISDFYLTSSRIRSISQMILFDPRLRYTTSNIEHAEAGINISLETISEWVTQSEINFNLIKQHIYYLLENSKQISISQILEKFPAEQGLGSIVGYMAIGFRYGEISHHKELVTWEGSDGITRTASIPRIYFLEANRHEFSRR